MTNKREMETEVEEYVRAPFVRMLIPDAEEGGFVAEVLELPGCVSEGETAEEAYRNLDDAIRGWVLASLKHQKPIPSPIGDRQYSGHFALRMPPELHRSVALRAAHEGVSLNQWIVAAIAARLAEEDLADRVVGRLVNRLSFQIIAGVSVPSGPGVMARRAGQRDFVLPVDEFRTSSSYGLPSPVEQEENH